MAIPFPIRALRFCAVPKLFRSKHLRFVSVPFHGLPFRCQAHPLTSASLLFPADPVQFNAFPSHSLAWPISAVPLLVCAIPSRCFPQLIRCDSPPSVATAYLFAAFPSRSKSELCKSNAELSWAIPRLISASFRFAPADPITTVLCLFNPVLCFAFATQTMQFRCVSMLIHSFAINSVPKQCPAGYAIPTQNLATLLRSLAVRNVAFPQPFSAFGAIPLLCQANHVWATQCQSNAPLAMQCRFFAVYAIPMRRMSGLCSSQAVPSYLCYACAALPCSFPMQSPSKQGPCCTMFIRSMLCRSLSPPGFAMRCNATAMPL